MLTKRRLAAVVDCTVHCQDTSTCNVTGGICGASNGPSNCNAQN